MENYCEPQNKTRDCVRKAIILNLMENGSMMIADLATAAGYSVPTIAKYTNELISEELVTMPGKINQARGKHPCIYALNGPSKYFIGVDIKRDSLSMAVMDLAGHIIAREKAEDLPFSNSAPYFEEMTGRVSQFIGTTGTDRNKIAFLCFNIPGRVDSVSGKSFSMFTFEGDDTPLADLLTERMGITSIIENDSRAMTFGWHKLYNRNGYRNYLFVNISYGLGLGIVIDGQIYRGENGYAGEFGHINTFNNQIICHCGKKGCLETEISGSAANRIARERIRNGETSILQDIVSKGEEISPKNLIDALSREDPLCIDILEKMGMELGRHLANLINIFNPESVVISGSLSEDNVYFIESIKSGIRKNSLKLMYKNVNILRDENASEIGVIGACMIGRWRFAYGKI
ncbi:MAG: ROK family transcriptional regulator [Candidatus Cryptobacteroides sp.]|nr:ROK family transcriptional regulator [Candidatus Cryptobacteroides sp.]